MFWITGLPRSGTAWLANWLTHGAVVCWHECERALCEDLESLTEEETWRRMERMIELTGGNCSSGLLFCPLELEGPKVIIQRDPEEVRRSLEKLGADLAGWEALLRAYARTLERWEGALLVPFEELFNQRWLLRLHQHLGIEPGNAVRYEILKDLRVERVNPLG